MDTNQRLIIFKVAKHIFCFSAFFMMLIYYPYSYAQDFWSIKPTLSFSEVFSDNINLERSGQEEEAFITELSPGISIRRNTARHDLNIDYRMQNLHNSGGNHELDTFHQLKADSTLEIFKRSLFLDLNANIGQQNATNLNSANNNTTGGGNNTNVTSYSISPYWTPHIDGYVKGDVRFKYTNLKTDNSGASDSEDFNYTVALKSGRRFSRITWLADYNRREQKREAGNNVTFESSFLEVRGHINRHYNVFAQFGHSENSFASNTNNNNNGVTYSFGAKWKPSERISLEAAIGNNSFVTVDLKPVRHMHWVTTYRNDDVGTNSGEVWESAFDYRTKNTVWNASYKEETTTLQNQLLNNQSFTLTNNQGNAVNNPVAQQPVQFNTSLPTLNDEVILTKTAEISVSHVTGRSLLLARLFSAKTKFQQTKTKNDVLGVSGSWDWNYFRRTNIFLRPSWQRTKRTNSKDNRYDIAVGIDRSLPVFFAGRGTLKGLLQYRYINQKSDLKSNEFIENRISANLLFSY